MSNCFLPLTYIFFLGPVLFFFKKITKFLSYHFISWRGYRDQHLILSHKIGNEGQGLYHKCWWITCNSWFVCCSSMVYINAFTVIWTRCFHNIAENTLLEITRAVPFSDSVDFKSLFEKWILPSCFIVGGVGIQALLSLHNLFLVLLKMTPFYSALYL